MPTISPPQSDAMTVLRTVLLALLPSGTEIVLGQANKVPEPASPNFVIMTPVRRSRLATNRDALDDCRIEGTIAGNLLAVSFVYFGTVRAGNRLWGTGVTDGTTVQKQLSGAPGESGTYQLSASSAISSPLVMGVGTIDLVAPYELIVQLDFHGAGEGTQAADNAQMASVALRDAWAVDQFSAANPNVAPLYADDPRQIPFINGANQYEDRWIVEAHLQVNETVALPQQYMDAANVGLIDVDAEYPP